MHCAVPITPTSFITIHGDKINEFDAAIAGPTSNEGWREPGRWETLKTSRSSYPGCAKIGNKVIIAGGYDRSAKETLQSTEVLDITTRSTSAGRDLASPRRNFNLATIRSGGRDKIFAVSGTDRTVEESSTWKEADSYVGTVALPEDIICKV